MNNPTQAIRKHPFQSYPLHQPNWLGRLLGRQPRFNAFVELKNALATSDSVRKIGLDMVEKLNTKYRTDVQRKFSRQLQGLHKDFMLFCLADHRFSTEEVRDVWHLKSLFGISSQLHKQTLHEVVEETFNRSIDEVLADSRVTREEEDFLEGLASYLRLPDETKMTLYVNKARTLYENTFQQAISDGRFSPDEEMQLQTLAEALGATIEMDGTTQAVVDRCRLMWRIAYGDPPTIDVPINLQRGEACYFAGDVKWHEMRRVTNRIRWGGPSLRIKICKGLYWKGGDYAVERISQDVLTPVDSGTVYLTNKRLLFNGRMRNTTIRLSRILDFTTYKNGIDIVKDSGKTPFLGFEGDIQLFSALLARAFQDLH